MRINIDNFSGTKGYDIDLRQKEVGGGRITIEQIDAIRQYPDAKSIIISGLEQKTFEYFISEYGNQFQSISFWKNKSVENLSMLSELEHIEFITYFFNQKVTKLWDMRKNKKLKGLQIDDFTRLHTIDEIEYAPALEVFNIGNAVWSKMKIESFKPVAKSMITRFSWYGDKVNDSDYRCLANGRIKVLDISPRYFTLDELANLLSVFPKDLEGTITRPYSVGKITEADGTETTYYFLCKGKKKCIKGIDDGRFQSYLDEFSILLDKYRKI